MTGYKGKQGRKKEPSTLIKEALSRNDGRVPEMLQRLYEIAIDTTTDRKLANDILQYLIDRSVGRPKAILDQRVKAELDITPDEYYLMAQTIIRTIESQQLLLTAPQKLYTTQSANYLGNAPLPEGGL